MIATSAIAGLILVILSPYGTHNFTFSARLVFWVGLCITGGIGAAGFDFLLTKLGRILPPWQQAIGQSIGATLMVAIFYFGLTQLNNQMPPFRNIVLILFYIWVISLTISGVGMLIRKRQQPTDKSENRPVLIDRLKPQLRNAEIYALAAEDHYVRIMTSKGDDLILMRLSDAIKEISPLPGLSPHRSWWVAESGVKQVKKTGDKLSLLLNNETVVPVSRNSTKSLREAGWA